MSNYRSRSGCLTCRMRRVKCDETRPVCNACHKKNRPCRWDAPFTKFKDYQPEASSAVIHNRVKHDRRKTDVIQMEVDRVVAVQGDLGCQNRHLSPSRRSSTTGTLLSSSQLAHDAPGSPFTVLESSACTDDVSRSETQPHQVLNAQSRAFSHSPTPLTHEEAILVHHYTKFLSRWLDCTDATCQFTLGIPAKVKSCLVLLNAVLSLAGYHCGEYAKAEAAYQRCIALLIVRLSEDAASHDETLLCAIVILRFFEQLNVPSSTGLDNEQHLAGCSAIIRNSQGQNFVDPSAPSLREAAFWVYVRQCLYNATIHQQPPDIDFSLQLHPLPISMHNSHPLSHLRLETAWANQITWHTACAVKFCFEKNKTTRGRAQRNCEWEKLWDQVETWATERPATFNPIYGGQADEESVFGDIWFTADWHVVSYGFYHLSCILLLTYKPGLKFANRTARRLSDTDILQHARAICGACRSSPETVPMSIILCHTVFLWGALLTDKLERDEVLNILTKFENTHHWPTTWITNALQSEWRFA